MDEETYKEFMEFQKWKSLQKSLKSERSDRGDNSRDDNSQLDKGLDESEQEQPDWVGQCDEWSLEC